MTGERKPSWLDHVFGSMELPKQEPIEAEPPAPDSPTSEQPDGVKADPAPNAGKTNWLDRMFGRTAAGEPKPDEEPPSHPVLQSSEPEGPPKFVTSAEDVSHIPLPKPPAEPGEATPIVPEVVEGAGLEPIEPVGDDPEPSVVTPPAALDAGEAAQEGKLNWWSRLTTGMRRTSSSLSGRVTDLFTKRKLDADTLEELEDALIQADFGVETAMRIAEAVGKGRYEKGISPDEVRTILASEVELALTPVAQPLVVDAAKKPFVILMIGVNGAGKTTTIGKLALKLKGQGRSVLLAAGDTFRAAAVDQLRIWGERTGTSVVTREQGADAAGLAFDALSEARAKGTDVLLIDTAGRLQNKAGLMAELEKIVRVIRKVDPEAPHAVLLVLDATVGQNALSQVELFSQAAGVTGLVMTKLDGTARGGILVALAAKFGLPIHFIGVGEGVDDLEPFAARDFARAIAGLEAG